ncbi:class I SAM-dependent methyltransferase [Fulvivirgaceae bacterium BMA10]|uniref:Class I SAM-dependent methyltransferase n=1 Tax=Splendidivirga corallicola TaxID=3051826 RepID=A0ABT8KK74_9BACT|nr:class I SAM-dependent methyltransferase [Fulvivirgaceae bacterium BMA10]
MKAKYDKIGIGYNQTRKADKYLTDRLFYHLNPAKGKTYLDIGCGTGNYTIALNQKGVSMIGIDPSVEMLKIAKAKNANIQWYIGNVENIQLEDEVVDGAIASLTIHHWPDLQKGFEEMNRVLKKNSRLVIFTSTPHQMKGYWLNYYFPKMLEDSMHQMPTYEKVAACLENNSFHILGTEKYFVKEDLEDLFLQSGKYNPSLYLNKQVRRGISSFSLAQAKEVTSGLEKLEDDIESGIIDSIIEKYKHDEGDYLFIMAIKK